MRIIGEGPERAVLEEWIRRHDAASWVTLVGYVPHDQLASEYRRAWIVASASIAEGWGLALTEAAACGTPAVATDISGHRSSVIDGVTGLLAPPDRLADRFVDVLSDPALREQLGHRRPAPGAHADVGRLGLGRDARVPPRRQPAIA